MTNTIKVMLAIGLVSMSFSTKLGKDFSRTESSYDQYTVQLNPTEFDSLTNQYSKQNPSQTWGGRISKSELQKVINSAGEQSSTISFYFSANNEGRTSTMFIGGIENNSQFIIQNAGSSYSFCPTKCAMQSSSTNVTQTITTEQFQNQKLAYQSAHPGATLGGNFSKSAMQAIISSLSNFSNVNFRYITDSKFGKTSLVLIGGSSGQPNGETLILRNGNSDEAFCPTHCH